MSPQSGLELPACPACENVGVTAAFEWASGMRIHRCGQCELLFARPTPSAAELEAFHQGFL